MVETPRRGYCASLLCLFLLAGCASLTPESGKLSVVLLTPYDDAVPKGVLGLADQVHSAVSRAFVSSTAFVQRRPQLFESGWDQALLATGWSATGILSSSARAPLASALHVDAAALVTFVRSAEGGWRLWVRIVDLGTGAPLFSWSGTTPSLDDGGWSESLSRQWARQGVTQQISNLLVSDDQAAWAAAWGTAGTLSDRAQLWKTALEAARTEGDFEEARRLVALLEHQGSDPAWLKAWSAVDRLTEREATAAREAVVLHHLLARLPSTPLTPATAEVELATFLGMARSAALEITGITQRPDLNVAFRTHFGLDLSKALERLPMVAVPGGTFAMGSETGNPDERPVRSVTVDPLLVAVTEVTQDLFQKVLAYNPSLFAQGPLALRRPVERVTWFDAIEFCNRLSIRDGLEPVYKIDAREPAKGFPLMSAKVAMDRTKSGYRLPTEAEWEWAARGADAVNRPVFAGGDDPRPLGRFGQESGGTEAVAQYSPNPLGLFDLTGNVWEWCWDWYAKYPSQAQTNPEGAAFGVLRVGRGGSWHASAWNARITDRSYDNPGSRGSVLGFRVVRSLPAAAFSPPSGL